MKRKGFTHSLTQKVIAVGLSAAMMLPSSAALLCTTTVLADDEVTIPNPIAVYEAGEAEGVGSDAAPTVAAIEDAPAALEGASAWTLKDAIAGATETAEDGTVTVTGPDTDSALVLDNPFATDEERDKLVEGDDLSYSEFFEEMVGDEGDILWNTGVSISFWVKSPKGAQSSSLLTFKSEDVKAYHKNSVMKHRIAELYSEEAENDPNTEFYAKVLDTPYVDGNGESHLVYDFHAYAEAHGATVLYASKAIPQFVAFRPDFETDNYFYVGAVDENGNPTEEYNSTNCRKIASDNYFKRWFSDFASTGKNKQDVTLYQTLDSPGMEYGYATGILQLHSDATSFFAEDATKAPRYKIGEDGELVKVADGIQDRNNVCYYYDENANSPMKGAGAWHYVVYTITNAEFRCFVDGKIALDLETSSLETPGWAQQSFNLGTGYPVDYRASTNSAYLNEGYYFSPNCNGKTVLQWLTEDTTQFMIGGASIMTSDAVTKLNAGPTSVVNTVEGVQIARVKFYDEELEDTAIAAIYADGDTTTAAPDVVYGDVSGDGKVEAYDALLILRAVVGLDELNETQQLAADVDGKPGIAATDALYVLRYVVGLITEFPVEQ